MDDNRQLYPFSFCLIEDKYLWGSEEFKLADLGYKDSLIREGWLAGNSLSEIMDTYVDRIVGENVYEFYGRQFPVCVRHLKVNGKTPLRVSPDDTVAAERYDFLGKERLWYVLRAGKDARIALGFMSDCDAAVLYAKCSDDSAEELLNVVKPETGRYYHIASGVPFAAFGEMEIVEIAQSSPLDFTLCRWGQAFEGDEFDEALGLVDALDFIDYKAYVDDAGKGEVLVDLAQFMVRKLGLKTALRCKNNEGAEAFVVYSCVSGAAAVQIDVLGQEVNYRLNCGDTVLVPAECSEFVLLPLEADSVLLETSVSASEIDQYIDPNIEENI